MTTSAGRNEAAAALSDSEVTLLDAYWRACNYLSVGMIYLRLGEEDNALRWFGAALRENPRYAPTHRALADFFRSKGDRARAEHHRQLAETGSQSLP